MASTGLIDHVVRPHVAQTEEKYLDNVPSSGAETYIPGQWPSGVNRIVSNVLALFEARTMSELCAPMPILSKHVVWDAPPFLLSRKGSIRVSSYLFKFVASQKFIPSLVQVRRVGLNSHLLEVSGTLLVYPRRTFLLPATLLLPHHIPIRATLSIGVSGDLDSGVVELVAVKWHNLPSLPNFLRAGNGLAFGTVPHLLEPIWSYLPEFIGDDFYKRKREATFDVRHPNSNLPALDAATDVVKDTVGTAMDYGVDSVHNMWDGANYLFNNTLEALGFGLGRARAYAGAATGLAANVANTAYYTATNVASTAYNTASNVAGTAANTAANVAAGAVNNTYSAATTTVARAGDLAYQAADTAAGTARVAYDTAADTASRAYEATADTARATYESTADTANRAYETTAGTARAAYDTTADTANRAYESTVETGNRVYESGRETVDSAAQAGRETLDAGRAGLDSAAEDFQRGYQKGKHKPVEPTIRGTLPPSGVST